MASTLTALLVKNLVAKKNSCELNSSSRQQPGPSLSERVRRFQLEVNSSMVAGSEKENRDIEHKTHKKKRVSHESHKKRNPISFELMLLIQRKTKTPP